MSGMKKKSHGSQEKNHGAHGIVINKTFNKIFNKTFILWFAAVVSLDVITKRLAIAFLQSPKQIIPDFLALELRYNTGSAFSLFQGWNIVLAAISIGFVIVAFYLQAMPMFQERINAAYAAGLGLMAGGALGNLIDRIIQGKVTDFIAFSFWPAFNVADSALVIGAFLFILRELINFKYSCQKSKR